MKVSTTVAVLPFIGGTVMVNTPAEAEYDHEKLVGAGQFSRRPSVAPAVIQRPLDVAGELPVEVSISWN